MKCKYIESVESEKEYQELSKLGKKLGIPVPETFLEMKVTMPNGKVINHFKQRSHSWNRNAYNFFFGLMASRSQSDNSYGAGKLSFKDNTGALMYSATNDCGAIDGDVDLAEYFGL
jgi:hypothetical protein